jgi:hypothetical protein
LTYARTALRCAFVKSRLVADKNLFTRMVFLCPGCGSAAGSNVFCDFCDSRPTRVAVWQVRIISGQTSGGRAAACLWIRGKSGLHETRVAGNARRVRAFRRGSRESATESKPPMAPRSFRGRGAQARVKGCGKSAPGRWQQRSHGKPHPEQGRIGASRPSLARAGVFRSERPGLAA